MVPRKTIYIRDEDLPIFERARKELDAPIGTIVVRALESVLQERDELWYKAFCLQLIRLGDMPIFGELIDYRLKDMPYDIVTEAGRLAELAERYEPMLIGVPWAFADLHPFMAIECGLGYEDEYFDIALKAARKAERVLEETRRAWSLAAKGVKDFPSYPLKGIATPEELTELPEELLDAVLNSGHSGLIELLVELSRTEKSFPKELRAKLKSILNSR